MLVHTIIWVLGNALVLAQTKQRNQLMDMALHCAVQDMSMV